MHPTRVTGCISYICSKSCINISTGKYGPRWKVAGHSVRMIGNACVKHTHTCARTLAHACIQRAAMFYPFTREIFNIYFNFTIFLSHLPSQLLVWRPNHLFYIAWWKSHFLTCILTSIYFSDLLLRTSNRNLPIVFKLA